MTTRHSLLSSSAFALLAAGALHAQTAPATEPAVPDDDWPAYNRTLVGDRFAPQDAITPETVADLTELCRYDVGRQTSFQTGPIVVGGTVYITTDFDTIALDGDDCSEVWRVTEDYEPASFLQVNRGAAILDGRIFRGTLDGRVLAYDVATGERLWERLIADTSLGETVPTALIAWDGMVFAGNAGGDNKGVKGRMYGLDATTGEIIWEQYLVPRGASDPARGPMAPEPPRDRAATWGNDADVPITGGASWTAYTIDPDAGLLYVPGGNPAPDFLPALRPGENEFAGSMVVLNATTGAYETHYPLVPEDFHDWDVSAAPALFTSVGGRELMASAIKDGYLRLHDRASGEEVARQPITTIENAKAPLTEEGTRFCPGSQGGAEWNGPAYSPLTNLVYAGAVDWCTTVRVQSEAEARAVSLGQPWSGMSSDDPLDVFGEFDDPAGWRGWVTAVDADSGDVAWQFETPAPVLGAITPTAGGVVFAGDMEGTLFALDAGTGESLLTVETGGAIGGGIVSYGADSSQRIAVASGMVSPIWPTPQVNAQLIVYGLTD